MSFQISKAHAYGNDFLFVPRDQVHGRALDTLTRRLCQRYTGLGADGVIYYSVHAEDATATMRLINADGSPSELSGNGLRCLGALLTHQRGREASPVREWRVSTDAGWKTLMLAGHHDTTYTFRAALGPPEHVTQEVLAVADELLPAVILTMANPQCVVLMPELPAPERFARLGPALSSHPRFPAGTNVEFAVVDAPDRVRILIWERGVGPTHASGTGASASAVAAHVAGGAGRDVLVEAPGGTQRVEWLDEGIFLTGDAEVLFDGVWRPR
jgi:diaminopimelate epimerase